MEVRQHPTQTAPSNVLDTLHHATPIVNKIADRQDLNQISRRAVVSNLQQTQTLLEESKLAYSSHMQGHWLRQWEYSQAILVSQVEAGMRILDAGGTGTLLSYYLALEGCDVHTVDLLTDKVANATRLSRRLGLPMTHSRQSITALDYPDNHFDRVFSICVIEHLGRSDQGPAVQELARVLKPGGILSLTFDFGADACDNPFCSPTEVLERLIAPSGLQVIGNPVFATHARDYGEPHHHIDYTFGSLFLYKPGVLDHAAPSLSPFQAEVTRAHACIKAYQASEFAGSKVRMMVEVDSTDQVDALGRLVKAYAATFSPKDVVELVIKVPSHLLEPVSDWLVTFVESEGLDEHVLPDITLTNPGEDNDLLFSHGIDFSVRLEEIDRHLATQQLASYVLDNRLALHEFYHALDDHLSSRFFRISDAWTDQVVFNLPSHWWSRGYEYEWAKSFAEPTDIALDAACGICHPLKFHLSDQCQEVYACDLDARLLDPSEIVAEIRREYPGAAAAHIPERYLDGIHYAAASITQLPYPDQTFDKVYCISVLEHMPHADMRQALSEFKRVLKDDGLIVLTFDFPLVDLGNVQAMLSELDLNFAGSAHFQFPSDAVTSMQKVEGGMLKLACFRAVLRKAH